MTKSKAIFNLAKNASTIQKSLLSSASKPPQQSQDSHSLAKAATSYFSNIRLKIASSLTSSLSPADRDQLLKTLDIKVSKEDQQELEKHRLENDGLIHKSIGEAVAAAVANEAARGKGLVEKSRQVIWQKAEKATMERVNNDLLIQERKLALRRWERELEAEKLALAEKDDSSALALALAERKIESEPVATVASKVVDTPHRDHPVLGPAVIDLGYKRIHVTSAQKLSAIPIWEKQRVYRHDRAKLMANDKLKSLELGLPGVIALHEATDGQLSILDGQHRVGMMTILEEWRNDGTIDFDLNQILVEVFPQSQSPLASETHAQDIFTEINKAEPVKLVDMPGVAKVTERRIINEAAALLEEKFPDMFKPSQRCRAPHLNVDNLRDSIFAAGIIKRHNIKSQKALITWVLGKNKEMEEKFGKDTSNSSNVSATALKKAKEFDFYLGLDMAWLYQ